MKFDKAIEETKQELLKKYKDVVYMGYEVVSMTSNTTTSNYIRERVNIDDLIKLNQECIKCKRLRHNGGDCKGRTSAKTNCLAFIQNRGGKYGKAYSYSNSY